MSPEPGILGRLSVGSSGGNLKPAQEQSTRARMPRKTDAEIDAALLTTNDTLRTFLLDVSDLQIAAAGTALVKKCQDR